MLIRRNTIFPVLNFLSRNWESVSTGRKSGFYVSKQVRHLAGVSWLTNETRFNKRHNTPYIQSIRSKKKTSQPPTLSQLVVPVKIDPNSQSDDAATSVGVELAGKISKEQLVLLLAKFYQRPQVKAAALEHGLDSKQFV